MGSLTLDRAQFIKDHNSYERIDEAAEIVNRLAFAEMIELDVEPQSANGTWPVRHSKLDFGSQDLSVYLEAIAAWHTANPTHDVKFINLDLKANLSNKASSKALDALITSYFPENDTLSNSQIFKPSHLLGSQPDLRAAASNSGWPTLSSLNGKFVFVITGGQLLRHNQTQCGYMEDRGHDAVCFLAPDVEEKDETAAGQAIDGFSCDQSKDLVIFNAKYGNRHDLGTSQIYNDHLLIMFWDVPYDEKNSSIALAAIDDLTQAFEASFIGVDYPENVGYPSNETASGQRGRDLDIDWVVCYEDDDCGGDAIRFTYGEYDNKGSGGMDKIPGCWNDEIRSVQIPDGVEIYMTDDSNFEAGKHGVQTKVGPGQFNLDDDSDYPKLAGKVSSVRVSRSN